jgi:general secretion pathway protein I
MLDNISRYALKGGHCREREYGFTLLEVVVATAIAGLALAGLFKAGTAGLFATDAAGRVENAVERAQSRLAAFGRQGAVAAGDMEGEDGGGYHWRLRAIPLVTERPTGFGNTAFLSLFHVQVMISWRAWGRDHSVVFDTRRIGASAPQ